MYKYLSILALCLSLCTFYTASLAQATEPSQTVLAQSKKEANTLLKQGDYAQAFTAYAALLRQDPYDDVINLGFARSAMQIQKPGQAVMAYERLLEKYPAEPRLLQELAEALHMQQDTQRATLELAKDTGMTSAYSADLMNSWEKKQSRTQISGTIRTGILYDSNVNSGPASNDITFDKRTITLADGKAHDSLAGYLGASIDLGYRLDTASPWWLIGEVDTFFRYNASQQMYDLNLSSSEWVSATMGMRYLSSKALFELKAQAQIFDYAFEQNVFSVGAESSFVYALTPKLHLITKASFDNRSYSENTNYDGWYGSIGQYVRYFMSETGSNVTLGGRYIGGSAKESDNSYDGFEATLQLSFILPYKKINISPFISYSAEYYHGPATNYDIDARRDYRVSTGLSVTIPLNEAWSVEAGYQYNNNISNSPLYDYDQHITNVGVSWKF